MHKLRFYYIPINDTTFVLSVFWPSDTEGRINELRFSESLSLSFKGSNLVNIHEVWPRPFWRGSSHQKKNTVDHFIGHIPFASLEGDKRPNKINQKSREFEHFMP